MCLEKRCGTGVLLTCFTVAVLAMEQVPVVDPGLGLVFLGAMTAEGVQCHPGAPSGLVELAEIHIHIN